MSAIESPLSKPSPSCTATKEELLRALSANDATVLSPCPLCEAARPGFGVAIGLHPSSSSPSTLSVSPQDTSTPSKCELQTAASDAIIHRPEDVVLEVNQTPGQPVFQTESNASARSAAGNTKPVTPTVGSNTDVRGSTLTPVAENAKVPEPAVEVHLPRDKAIVHAPRFIPRNTLIAPSFILPPDAKRMVFPSGAVYEGQMNDGRAHGYGRGSFHSGAFHIGRWEGNLRNGLGFHKYADGMMYEGEWKDNERCGFGVFASADGQVLYEGEWIHDEPARVVAVQRPTVATLPRPDSNEFSMKHSVPPQRVDARAAASPASAPRYESQKVIVKDERRNDWMHCCLCFFTGGLWGICWLGSCCCAKNSIETTVVYEGHK